MLKKVIGLKRLEYTSKKTGLPVKGWEIHMTYEDKNATGVLTESKYFSDKDLEKACVNAEDLFGHKIDIYYDEYKKPRYIRVEN